MYMNNTKIVLLHKVISYFYFLLLRYIFDCYISSIMFISTQINKCKSYEYCFELNSFFFMEY